MVELRYKGKYWVSVPVTTTDAAAKVKESAKSKANYQQIYFNFVEMDLIAYEFKLHKERQKMLTRPVRPQTDTTQGDLIGNFDKLVSDIDWRVTGIDKPLGMETAVKLYLGSDIDEASGETVKKRRREKTKLLDYWLKNSFRLLRRKNISFTEILDVIINVSRLSDKFTIKDDCDQLLLNIEGVILKIIVITCLH